MMSVQYVKLVPIGENGNNIIPVNLDENAAVWHYYDAGQKIYLPNNVSERFNFITKFPGNRSTSGMYGDHPIELVKRNGVLGFHDTIIKKFYIVEKDKIIH